MEGDVLRVARRRQRRHSRQATVRAVADGLVRAMFGLTSWSVLLPQAVEGVACVAILYACVRRSTGPSCRPCSPASPSPSRRSSRWCSATTIRTRCSPCCWWALGTPRCGHSTVTGRLVGSRLLEPCATGIPHEDAGRAHRRARPRTHVPRPRPRSTRVATRQSHDRGDLARSGGRLVGRDRRAVARCRTSFHRRLVEQLHRPAGVGLQRCGAHHRLLGRRTGVIQPRPDRSHRRRYRGDVARPGSGDPRWTRLDDEPRAIG